MCSEVMQIFNKWYAYLVLRCIMPAKKGAAKPKVKVEGHVFWVRFVLNDEQFQKARDAATKKNVGRINDYLHQAVMENIKTIIG